MENRYLRNIPAITPAQQEILKSKRAAVIGCGGLGGYIIEFLTRFGIGHITACDGDVFDETNLNRQILATESTIRKPKVLEAMQRAKIIDSSIDFNAVYAYFSDENAETILNGCDIVMDALDSGKARIALEKACAERELTIVHGAISEYSSQVCVVPPKSGILTQLFYGREDSKSKTSLSYIPPYCASIQCAEALKILLGETPTLIGKLLICDLNSYDTDIIQLQR